MIVLEAGVFGTEVFEAEVLEAGVFKAGERPAEVSVWWVLVVRMSVPWLQKVSGTPCQSWCCAEKYRKAAVTYCT